MGNNIVYILRQIKQLRYAVYYTVYHPTWIYSMQIKYTYSMYPTLYKELGDNIVTFYNKIKNQAVDFISNF